MSIIYWNGTFVLVYMKKFQILLVLGNESNCQHEGPGTIIGMPSAGVFLRDPSVYLHKFRRKPRKTPKDMVDKRDREMSPAPPVNQFWAQNRSATGSAETVGEISDIKISYQRALES